MHDEMSKRWASRPHRAALLRFALLGVVAACGDGAPGTGPEPPDEPV